MKKLFLLLTLSLCMLFCDKVKGEKTQEKKEPKKEVALNDDIQDTFFGVKFGASKEEVIKAFEKQGLHLDERVSTNEYLSFGTYEKYFSFGGMAWQFVNVGLSNGKFWFIRFNLTPENKETALELYEGVLEQVASKYNVAELPIENENVYKKSAGCTKDGKYVTIVSRKGESVGGEMRYYLTLSYKDEKIKGVSNEL
ncbi:MAG: hypothetical protein IIX43_01010 [Bacteroidales bacterium]|nr:hypothetical protein [Bacteroidales bacterium]